MYSLFYLKYRCLNELAKLQFTDNQKHRNLFNYDQNVLTYAYKILLFVTCHARMNTLMPMLTSTLSIARGFHVLTNIVSRHIG